MDDGRNVFISLQADEGVFLEGAPVLGTVELRRPSRLVRLVLRFQWRVRGSGEAASDGYEIDLLEPSRGSPSARASYPFELPCSLDRMLDAPCGWYADALLEGRESDERSFQLTANIVVLPPPKRGAEGAYR
jgi:hypothetical protein